MKINCIIIEDEPLALERTKAYVLKLPFLNLLATFDNGIDSLVFLKSNKTDLIFLDIQMDEFSGIQLLEAIKFNGEVIITTAYNEYALKGFDLNVTDYLMKPFTFDRFIQAVDKAQNNLAKKDITQEKKFVFVKTEYRLEKVNLDDILYIEGMRDYRCIHLRDKRIMTLQTFTDLEQDLPTAQFCRVHKSFIVALDKIESIERDRIKIKSELIPVSDTYKENFYKRIKA